MMNLMQVPKDVKGFLDLHHLLNLQIKAISWKNNLGS